MTDLIDIPLTEALIRGAVELERTEEGLLPHRLPAWARAQAGDAQTLMVEAQASGVRLEFATEATFVELEVLPTKRAYVGLPARPSGIHECWVNGAPHAERRTEGGNLLLIDGAAGTMTTTPGAPVTLRFDLPPGNKMVALWLPHDEQTVLRALRADAPVGPAEPSGRRRWLHHGSSISHGSNATHPTGTWPAVAARHGGVELQSLGFGGAAMLDPFTARTIRDTAADLISLKLGINLVNGDVMRRRVFGPAVHGFLDTIREGHPTTPLLVVSPILCPMHEAVPGPTAPDMTAMMDGRISFVAGGNAEEVAAGKLTLEVIRSELARIVAQRAATDPNLYYLDGCTLYGEADAEALPLPDALHPDAAAHRLMGERFAEQFVTGAFRA
ncbi:GDSL-type esterase/lipase family protein [Devosia sp.]|uniref:GDSL-type esterase/lipase family protein n=1 Tax=Devosia sp. TaxID=1871048 RepID=UPI003A8D6C79